MQKSEYEREILEYNFGNKLASPRKPCSCHFVLGFVELGPFEVCLDLGAELVLISDATNTEPGLAVFLW